MAGNVGRNGGRQGIGGLCAVTKTMFFSPKSHCSLDEVFAKFGWSFTNL